MLSPEAGFKGALPSSFSLSVRRVLPANKPQIGGLWSTKWLRIDSLFWSNGIHSLMEMRLTLQGKRDPLFTGQDLLSQRSERRAYGS